VLRPFDDLIDNISRVHKTIAQNRFWLGEKLWVKHDSHMKNLGVLAHELRRLVTSSKDNQVLDNKKIEELKKRVDEEIASRVDVEMVMRLI